MPRQRGAADQRQVRRKRGEHDNQTSGARAQQRTDTHAVAEPTTDSLQLFINQAMKYPLLTAAEEVELAQADREGRPRRQGAADQLQPAAGDQVRAPLPGLRPAARRPRPGGDARADPRCGEVRLAPRLQVLDLRRAVDQAVDSARPRQHRPPGADSGAHRPARADGQPHHHRARGEAQPRAHRRGGREEGEAAARRGDGRSRPDPGDDEPRHARSATATRRSASCMPRAPPTSRTRCSSASRRRRSDTALAKLPDAERQIIEARFGTGGRPELSIREAARALGVTQNAARELEARALARLATDGSLSGFRAAA